MCPFFPHVLSSCPGRLVPWECPAWSERSRSRQLRSRALISIHHICNAAEDIHFLLHQLPLHADTVPSWEPRGLFSTEPCAASRLHGQGQRQTQPSHSGKDTGVRMGVVSKKPSTGDPCPGLTLASGMKDIGRGRKGTRGALDHTWVVPSCRPGPSSSEGRNMHVGRGLSLSYLLPSS